MEGIRQLAGRIRVPLLLGVIGVLALACYFVSNFPFVMGDCVWSAPVAVWIDLDEDGVRDADEPPLEGVEFIVNDTRNNYSEVGEADRSDYNGESSVMVWLPGCPKARFEVVAEVPDGYRLTTASPFQVEGKGYGDDTLIEFGFAPLPGTSLPTPYVPKMTCIQRDWINSDDLVGTEEGLWTAHFDSATLYDPITLQGIRSVQQPEYMGGIDLLVPTEHGMWFDSLISWVYFDGENWFEYELNRSEAVDVISPAFQQSDDGRLWFASRHYLAIFNPDDRTLEAYLYGEGDLENQRFVILRYNEDWFAARIAIPADTAVIFDQSWEIILDKTYSASDLHTIPSVLYGGYLGLGVSPDKSIWTANAAQIIRFIPDTETWLTYNARERDNRLNLNDMAVHPDGTVWVVDGRKIMRLIPHSSTTSEAEWQLFDARDGFADHTAELIAIDPNGMVWLTSKYGPDILNRCELLTE